MSTGKVVMRDSEAIVERTPRGGRRAARLLDRAAGGDSRRWLDLRRRALERVEELEGVST